MSTLAVRLDSLGDAIVTSPGFRAIARRDGPIDVLCGPAAMAVMPYLPGVRRAHAWSCPWIDASAPAIRPQAVRAVQEIAQGVDEAVIFTSYHQSALPMALLLRMAGVRRIGAYSTDFPGSLLDVRAQDPGDVPEPERALALARECGFPDDGPQLALTAAAVSASLPFATDPDALVVVHPGASSGARRWPAERMQALVASLAHSGFQIVVTGGAGERDLCDAVAGEHGRSTAGELDVAQLATLLSRARCLVSGNTGPAHLAAAVGTAVACLFSPVVPAARWAPYGVPVVVLGDLEAACAGTRARECPIPGHPCLSTVTVQDVTAAVVLLSGADHVPGDAACETNRPMAAELEETR